VTISYNHFVVIDFVQNHPYNRRLEFTSAEVIDTALVFVKMPDQMGMLFTLLEPLRREYIANMLQGNFLNFSLRSMN
jgi:hypothetical protein